MSQWSAAFGQLRACGTTGLAVLQVSAIERFDTPGISERPRILRGAMRSLTLCLGTMFLLALSACSSGGSGGRADAKGLDGGGDVRAAEVPSSDSSAKDATSDARAISDGTLTVDDLGSSDVAPRLDSSQPSGDAWAQSSGEAAATAMAWHQVSTPPGPAMRATAAMHHARTPDPVTHRSARISAPRSRRDRLATPAQATMCLPARTTRRC